MLFESWLAPLFDNRNSSVVITNDYTKRNFEIIAIFCDVYYVMIPRFKSSVISLLGVGTVIYYRYL